jgi:hypothetical protein
MTDQEMFLEVGIALIDLHSDPRIAASPPARLALRRIAYILNETPMDVREKIEKTMAHGLQTPIDPSGPRRGDDAQKSEKEEGPTFQIAASPGLLAVLMPDEDTGGVGPSRGFSLGSGPEVVMLLCNLRHAAGIAFPDYFRADEDSSFAEGDSPPRRKTDD